MLLSSTYSFKNPALSPHGLKVAARALSIASSPWSKQEVGRGFPFLREISTHLFDQK